MRSCGEIRHSAPLSTSNPVCKAPWWHCWRALLKPWPIHEERIISACMYVLWCLSVTSRHCHSALALLHLFCHLKMHSPPKSGESPNLLSPAFAATSWMSFKPLDERGSSQKGSKGQNGGSTFLFPCQHSPSPKHLFSKIASLFLSCLVFTAILSVQFIMAQFKAGAPPKCRPTLEVAPLGLSQGKLQVVSRYSSINHLHKLRWTLFLPQSVRLKQQKHIKKQCLVGKAVRFGRLPRSLMCKVCKTVF